MPKGYVIARVTVTNPEAYAEYAKGATAAIKQYGGRPLVRGGAHEALEGEARPRNVVIEFDSMEQARRYYHSPEYQAAKAKREGACIAEFVLVEGAE
ncbi:DUF1330 domain-containing protein [Microvirga puerhi]|uniref:DUF1330 domain-containing protein n=1 Tax=Microvirga puerhi TaxID=2876078 RepID=A0ABS7VME4_9HYPH|nr:DUF1330 domain-containing protein [Microvirga puerhi]MBZ6076714.1 DUF1330 domain-containing protein [Microvirga puerhi]